MGIRNKKITNKDGVEVKITFEGGELHYQVNNFGQMTKSGNLHQALKLTNVPEKSSNFFVRGVKKALGL